MDQGDGMIYTIKRYLFHKWQKFRYGFDDSELWNHYQGLWD